MDLVERVLRHLEHLHVGPELLDQGLDDGLGGGRARHPDTLSRNLNGKSITRSRSSPLKLYMLAV